MSFFLSQRSPVVNAAAWRWRGGLERNLGLQNEAFISWMKAWRLRPYDFTLNNNLAAVLASQGRLDEAQKFMDLAAKSPLPTPELAEKWKERQKQFQAVINQSRIAQEAAKKVSRNSPCPHCAAEGIHIKFKKCKHGKGV